MRRHRATRWPGVWLERGVAARTLMADLRHAGSRNHLPTATDRDRLSAMKTFGAQHPSSTSTRRTGGLRVRSRGTMIAVKQSIAFIAQAC